MNYQTYAGSSSTYPPTQYHHPAATATYHPYDASPRLGAAATTAGSAGGGAITTAAVAYPQYPTQEQPHLQHTMQQQPEYLHQQQQQISYHHRYYPPLPPRHLQQHEAPSLPPPHPLLSPPIAGYDVEPKDEVGHLKQQIRQSSMEQEQQQHPQDEDEQHAPSLSQKEIEASSDITLNQTTTNISMPDSTTNGLREEQKESQQQQHEKKEVMSDDRSPDAAATTTTTVNTAVDASEDAELLIAVESKKNEKLAAEEESKLATATTTTTTAAANTTTCEMGQSPPLPENEVATNIAKPPSSSQAIVDDDNDAPKHTTERVFPFDTILTTLQQYETKYHTLSIPTTHPSFIDIVSHLVQHGIEDEADMLWERNFKSLQEYKDRVGDCDVPFTTKMLGPWVVRQRELYAKLQLQPQKEQVQASFSRQSPKTLTSTSSSTEINKLHTSRFQRLSQLGFDFTTPMWDVRLQELISYKSIHQDCSPPVSYPKLGIWTINQRFNLKDMPKERVEALDALGFVWNHNRKNRSQKKWDGRYEECELQYLSLLAFGG